MQWRDLLTGLCLVLVFEGVMPFLAPHRWKEAIRQMAAVDDNVLRGVGLASMAVGAALLYIVR